MSLRSYTSPSFLQPGDRIGVCCPSSKIDYPAALYACDVLRSWGFSVQMGKTVQGHFHNFSATDDQRLEDLQQMLDDPAIRAIVFGRGGYGMMRIMDRLDWAAFIRQPKWLCGYSDITALHLQAGVQCQVQTIHSVMCSGITPATYNDPFVESLRSVLMGKAIDYTFSPHPGNRSGKADGRLIGGNLCLLAASCGSSTAPDVKDCILFLEDTGEYFYAIDRMMMTLQRAGWLHDLAGLVVGSFTDTQDTEEPFGQQAWELIYDKISTYGYPVGFGFPVGHQAENYALKIGAMCTLQIGTTCRLTEKQQRK